MTPMATSHLTSFLEDVGSIEPGFRESSSILSGLMAYLREDGKKPKKLSKHQVWLLCDCDEKRIAKYAKPLRRLIGVWGTMVPYPGREGPVKRLVFRGDGRSPDLIYSTGFTPRKKYGLRYREAMQDIDPEGAVAATATSPLVAANFPLPENVGSNGFKYASNTPSWVYAIYMERGYNTNTLQNLSVLNSGSPTAKRLVYARELATTRIPPTHVLGSIQVDRNFIYHRGLQKKPPYWFANGVFRFITSTLKRNVNYKGPSGEAYWQGFIGLIDKRLHAFPRGN